MRDAQKLRRFLPTPLPPTRAVFGVLTSEEQQLLHDLLARVVEQGTGHALFKEHTDS